MQDYKYIFALRHAKASVGTSDMSDHERPLAPPGVIGSHIIGNYMKKQGLMPSFTLCSTSTRTRETYTYLCESYGSALPVSYTDRLYLANAPEINKEIQSVGEDCHSVMLIGHNPGIHQFSLFMVGKGDREALEELEIHFPTAALAIIRLANKPWKELEQGDGYLEEFILPKKIDKGAYEQL